jgi:hypothetical protein
MSKPSPGSTPKNQAKRRAERLVYESPSRKALKRSHPTVPGADGKQHLYLNAALPRDHRTNAIVAPLQSSVCGDGGRCGHAYAHLMTSGRSVCEECRLQDIAALAAELQAAGIELGWGATPMDKRAGKMSHGDIQTMHVERKR